MKTPVDPHLYSADYYLERCGGVEFFHKFGFKVLKPSMQAAVLAADLQPGHRILDVGCGRGELVAYLTEQGFDVTGVDYSSEAVEVAKKLYPKGRFLLSDANSMGLTGRFDRIFILGTIEHLHDQEIEKMMRQVESIISPDGIVVLSTCTNQLYFKVWSYKVRAAAVRFLRRLGFSIKDPRPPRSDEDESLHINETHYFKMKRHFNRAPWNCRLLPLANPKLTVERLYPSEIWPELPIRRASAFKKALASTVFWFPLNLFFARNYLAVLSKVSTRG